MPRASFPSSLTLVVALLLLSSAPRHLQHGVRRRPLLRVVRRPGCPRSDTERLKDGYARTAISIFQE